MADGGILPGSRLGLFEVLFKQHEERNDVRSTDTLCPEQSGADTHGLAAVINHSKTSEEWHVAPT